MKLDLTSKLASVGLELSKANTEKLEQALETVLSEFQDELRAKIAPSIESGKRQLDEALTAAQRISNETAMRLSSAVESSSKSFETDLELYRDHVRRVNSQVSQLEKEVRDLRREVDRKSEAMEINTRSRRVVGAILVLGVLIGVGLTTLIASQMASGAQQRASLARGWEREHLAALDAFQSLYGVSLSMTEGGTPLFNLPPGKKLVSTKGLFDMLDQTNRWRVK